MPELPEVETVARELRRSVVGAVIVRAQIAWAGAIGAPSPERFAQGLSGRRIQEVTRRGKWIILKLDSGQALLLHLRMTGRILVSSGECPESEHVRVSLMLNDGRHVCFHDVRKFGRLCLADRPAEIIGDLGPEPLDPSFGVAELSKMLAHSNGRIKPLLLNQRFLAGLGNIYTDEALWRAAIHPLRRANSLRPSEVEGLWAAIRSVLIEAIDSGGTTLEDGGFVGAAGQPGDYAGRLAVYGRAGDPCLRCDGLVERIVVGQRGTHICPSCQFEPEPD